MPTAQGQEHRLLGAKRRGERFADARGYGRREAGCTSASGDSRASGFVDGRNEREHVPVRRASVTAGSPRARRHRHLAIMPCLSRWPKGRVASGTPDVALTGPRPRRPFLTPKARASRSEHDVHLERRSSPTPPPPRGVRAHPDAGSSTPDGTTAKSGRGDPGHHREPPDMSPASSPHGGSRAPANWSVESTARLNGTTTQSGRDLPAIPSHTARDGPLIATAPTAGQRTTI